MHSTLLDNPVVTERNKDKIVETLRQIAEVIIWGDQHNPEFFE
jgi:protein CLEC16A